MATKATLARPAPPCTQIMLYNSTRRAPVRARADGRHDKIPHWYGRARPCSRGCAPGCLATASPHVGTNGRTSASAPPAPYATTPSASSASASPSGAAPVDDDGAAARRAA